MEIFIGPLLLILVGDQCCRTWDVELIAGPVLDLFRLQQFSLLLKKLSPVHIRVSVNDDVTIQCMHISRYLNSP